MELGNQRASGNVEDRRGIGMVGGGLGVGGIVVAVIAYFLGFDPVIAHEVGHHVQKLTGNFKRLEAAQARGKAEINRTSVRMELQADCYAGIWGHYAGTMKQLSPGDVEEALNAANAIGDDRLQKQAQGRVVPDSFTHGSSEQRMTWFKRGLDSGNPKSCDTFSAAKP